MIRFIRSLAFLLVLLPSQLSGGAWTRNSQSMYLKVSGTYLGTSEAYDQNGDKFATTTFTTWSLNLYSEYGVTNRLTAILRAPLIRSAAYENTENLTKPGDIGIGLKYGLIRGSTPVAIAIEPEFPTGEEIGTVPVTDGSGGTVRLPTGDGEYNTLVRTSVSHSFYPIPGYVSFDAGYNFRTEGFTDEYLFMIQAGYELDHDLWLQGNLHAKGPVTTPDSALASMATLGFGEGVQFVAYSVGLSYGVNTALELTFDAYSAFGKITSIYSGVNFVLGIAWRVGT